MKYIVDIKGEIEGDYEIIGKYEERLPEAFTFAQPDVPDTNVGDMISRQAAIDVVKFGITYAKAFNKSTGEVKELFKEGNKALKEAAERLKELPSAQPEIIRCKDCKNYYFADNRVPSEQSWVCDAWGIDQTAHMGYCFKAERKEE